MFARSSELERPMKSLIVSNVDCATIFKSSETALRSESVLPVQKTDMIAVMVAVSFIGSSISFVAIEINEMRYCVAVIISSFETGTFMRPE